MKIQNVKGGYDFLPQEQKIRNYINNILKESFEQYGFVSIETPILCYYDILSDKYDADNDILKEIYKLKDQGNRQLGLRYDLTVPFAKFIALNKKVIKFPFRRYEIAKSFRDGPVRVGRDREFTQCDADVVGLAGQYVEAELLSLFVTAFKKLDIAIIIKYNSRNLMNGLILESGIPEDMIASTTTIIDKKDKLTKDELSTKFAELGLTPKQITKLDKLFTLSLEELTKKFANTNNENIQKGLTELNNLQRYLKGLNIDQLCIFSSSLARGQNYYTGNVFEVYDREGLINGSIGAGGRYDKMITDFIRDGQEYPTVGISFGLSSIYEILKARNILQNKATTDIYIIPMNTEIESLNLANYLRALNYKVEVEMTSRKIRKSLDYANKEQIQYVIIFGENELKNNSVIIKDMFNNNNISLKLNDIDKIKEYL